MWQNNSRKSNLDKNKMIKEERNQTQNNYKKKINSQREQKQKKLSKSKFNKAMKYKK